MPLISDTSNKHKISASPLYSSLSTSNITLNNVIPTVIKGLREDESLLVPYGLLLEDAKILSRHFDELRYSHTKREGNNLAHSLVRYVVSIPDFLVWMEDVP